MSIRGSAANRIACQTDHDCSSPVKIRVLSNRMHATPRPSNSSAYDQLVTIYAQANHTPLDGKLLALAERLVQRLAPGERLLDVGCGTGRDLAWFTGRGLRAVGVDLSAGMLAFAQAHLETPRLAQMDMLHLGFPPGSFAGLWSCASLLHLSKTAAPLALAAFRQVLRPGGALALSIQGGQGETWEPAYGTPIERFFARYTSEEMAALLVAAGFQVEQIIESAERDRHWISYLCQ